MATKIPYALHDDVRFAIIETGLLGPIGAFSTTADVAAIGGFWGYLLVKFSDYYNLKLDKDAATKICISALLGLGGYYTGCKTATKFFHALPIAGTFMAMGLSSVQNVIFTYRYAETLAKIFNMGKVDYVTLADSIKNMLSRSGMKELFDLWGLVELFAGTSEKTGNSLNAPKTAPALPAPAEKPKTQTEITQPAVWKNAAGDESVSIWISQKNGRSVFCMRAKNRPFQVELFEIKRVFIVTNRTLCISTGEKEYRLEFPNNQLADLWRLRLKNMITEVKEPARQLTTVDTAKLILHGETEPVTIKMTQKSGRKVFCMEMKHRPMQVQLFEIKNLYSVKSNVLRIVTDTKDYRLEFANAQKADQWKQQLKTLRKAGY